MAVVGQLCVAVLVPTWVRGTCGVALVHPLLPGVVGDLVPRVFGLVALVLRAGVSTVLRRGSPVVIGAAVVGVPAVARSLRGGMVDVAVPQALVAGMRDASVPGIVSVRVLTMVAVLMAGVAGAVVIRPLCAGVVVRAGVPGAVQALVAAVAHAGMVVVPHPGVVVLVAGPPEQSRR
jgi:hypothetical protein